MKDLDQEKMKERNDKLVNEYFRKKIHVCRKVLDFAEARTVEASTGELIRNFKLSLSKKLAQNEGVFKDTKITLYLK